MSANSLRCGLISNTLSKLAKLLASSSRNSPGRAKPAFNSYVADVGHGSDGLLALHRAMRAVRLRVVMVEVTRWRLRQKIGNW